MVGNLLQIPLNTDFTPAEECFAKTIYSKNWMLTEIFTVIYHIAFNICLIAPIILPIIIYSCSYSFYSIGNPGHILSLNDLRYNIGYLPEFLKYSSKGPLIACIILFIFMFLLLLDTTLHLINA